MLYWMTTARRARSNFGLQRAVEIATELQRPLVVLEALRCDYPWASDRLHRFILDGMAANAAAFAGRRLLYYPYVEDAQGAGRGLIAALGQDACLDRHRLVSRLLSAADARSRRDAGAGAARGCGLERHHPGR